MAHTEYKHVIDAVELNATALGGLVRGTLRAGITVDRETSSGGYLPEMQFISERKPQASWESRAIKSWLQQVGLYGKEIDDLAAGLKLYLKKAKHGGTRYTGSNHLRYTARSGMILPRRLSVSHRQAATINYDAAITYDGTNASIAVTSGVSLPGGLTDDERYGLGPWSFEGGDYKGITSLELDFGLTEDAQGADSDVDDTEVSISDVKPELVLRGIDPTWFGASAVPLDGLEIGHVTSSGYLRRYKKRSTLYPNNQSQHIKITVSGLAYLEEVLDAGENRASETALRIPLDYDGSNDPVKFTFDTTIA